MTYTTLVSTEVLAAHADDWAIIDCRFDLQREAWGRDQYFAAHIPGAVYAGLSQDLAGGLPLRVKRRRRRGIGATTMMIETMLNVLLVAVPLALAAAGIGAVLLRLGRTGDLNR